MENQKPDSAIRKVAMLQPNYIPWKGVFDMISRVDVFVFYDDVQYTHRDWRNRNKIKTPTGEMWLTVPVKQNREQLICEAEIDMTLNWQSKHLKAIKSSYARAKYFSDYEFLLEELYVKRKWEKISDLGIFSTKLIAKTLGLNPEWRLSSELKKTGDKSGEKILNICEEIRCGHVLNGPASREFMDEKKFVDKNVTLAYMEYSYPEYPQLYPPFTHQVSALDVVFNCGPDAGKYIFKRPITSMSSHNVQTASV
ncbi:MAG: WbqC family protein [Bdellovibrionales bacterium]|nr:WbqC family protein [Bdellovibrionales bacterium]